MNEDASTPAHQTSGDEEAPKRGKVLATFLVRVTMRENADGDPDEEMAGAGAVPTNEAMEAYVEAALYDVLPYFHAEAINATAEKV